LKASGIPFPEVFWPAVACEAWPALSTLDAQTLDDFLLGHAEMQGARLGLSEFLLQTRNQDREQLPRIRAR
jgi:hypothetical protein